MISSTLRALGCLLLAFSAAVFAHAQNPAQKKTSSIGGKVTLKGNGVAGITVGAVNQGSGVRGRFAAVTDSQGNYRISDLAAGTYEVTPAAPQFVLTSMNMSKRVILEEGETLDDMNFVLVRGGVITGKVTNSDGQPLIEEPINLGAIERDQPQSVMRLNMYFIQTDDRGIYRAFGLPPGKYTVSAGTPQNRLAFATRNPVKYKQTYYPSVTNESQATVIEVTEGSEANNVDIVVSARQTTYSVSGRVINGETGKPVANARYGIMKIEENGSSGSSGPSTNALGEFKIDSLTPGRYMVTLELDNDFYAETPQFEIEDHDITDLVLKTSSGARVSGVVVFEGLDQKVARQKFGQVMIMIFMASNERFASRRNGPPVSVGADGSFSIGGLSPGEAHFSVFAPASAAEGRNFQIARVERDGVVQSRNLEVKDREQVTGVRIVVSGLTGMLQGTVKVENGQVPAGQLVVTVKKPGESGARGVPLDARGRFRIGGLSAGTYEVAATAYLPNLIYPPSTKQEVVINDDQVTEVTLTLDLKSPPVIPDRP